MINYGNSLCPHCKTILDLRHPCFYDAKQGIAVETAGGKDLRLLHSSTEDPIVRTPPRLVRTKRKKGLITSIVIDYPQGHAGPTTRHQELTIRCCPVCYQAEEGIVSTLPVYAGLYPTKLLVALGSPAVGKTTWINSATQDAVVNKLSNAMIAGEIMALNSQTRTHMYLPNKITGKIAFRSLAITNRRGKIKEVVMLLDSPGELLLSSSTEPEAEALKLLISRAADGILIFHDQRAFLDINQDIAAVCRERNDALVGSVSRLMSRILQERGRQPACVINVITHGDILKEASLFGLRHNEAEIDAPPILSAKSPLFVEEALPIREALQRHMALARELVYSGGADTVSTKYPSFVVSSGVPTDAKKGFDFRNSVNTHLTLAYLLANMKSIRI